MSAIHEQLINSINFKPISLEFPDAWSGHLHFAYWLVKNSDPDLVVELGSHTGNSYFSICQSVLENALTCRTYAVDTWEGDDHAGRYGNDIFEAVTAKNEKYFKEFSTLIRSTFDEAVHNFLDASIDILHIDGLHTYEAVKHDFETWIKKVKPNGIVLFHDTCVLRDDFGVWKLWEELEERYDTTINFKHSNGLGVLQLGNGFLNKYLVDSNCRQLLIDYFSTVGSISTSALMLRSMARLDADLAIATDLNQERAIQIQKITAEKDEIEQTYLNLHTHAVHLECEIGAIKNSKTWRWTVFFRNLYAKLRKLLNGIKKTKLIIKQYGLIFLAKKICFELKNQGVKKGLVSIFQAATRFKIIEYGLEDFPKIDRANYLPTGLISNSIVSYGIDSDYTVDIIIPVYKNVSVTKACVDSVLGAINQTKYRLIVINDGSPESEVDDYVESLRSIDNVVVLNNEINLGFVKTVNIGMSLDQDRDVILLNSDTVVPDGWIDRLIHHNFLNKKIATITPFSNNATICSYPSIYGMSDLPNGESLSTINDALVNANSGKSLEIPTGVGFCMFISRTSLNAIGLFDEIAFGKGYGEENDFCLRAINAGYKNLLAADLYVYHAGEVSFQESAKIGKKSGESALLRKHPDYNNIVSRFIQEKNTNPLISAATAARYKLSQKYVILFITHDLGGGVDKHINDLVNNLQDRAYVLCLKPVSNSGNKFILTSLSEPGFLELYLWIPNELDFLRQFIESAGVEKIHIHHIMGGTSVASELIKCSGLSFVFTVHDYYAICPKVTLTKNHKYCNEIGIKHCNACIAKHGDLTISDIIEWRVNNSWLFLDAEKVICPSKDVKDRISKYFPNANLVVVPHESPFNAVYKVRNIRRDYARVAVLGKLAPHKGSRLVSDLLEELDRSDEKLKIKLIGSSDGMLPVSSIYSETGDYSNSALDSMIDEYDPDLIFFPSVAPETYSYTLTSAMKSGRRILVPNIGAFPERIQHYREGYLYDHTLSAAGFLRQIKFVLSQAEKEENAITTQYDVTRDFYRDQYITRKLEFNQRKLPMVIVIPEMVGSRFSPCSYIRLILPLMSAYEAGALDLRVVDPRHDISKYQPDYVVTNRTALNSAQIRDLFDLRDKFKFQIVFDLDDNLFELGEVAASEYNHYKIYAAALRLIAEKSDLVTCSTRPLQEYLLHFNKNVHVVENTLLSDLWKRLPKTFEKKSCIDILYMGTKTHNEDLMLVINSLNEVLDGYGGTVRLNLIGVSTENYSSRYVRHIDIPNYINSYPSFVTWLNELNIDFDIGIAPLVNNGFNKYKSNIKFLDYTALGIPVLCSGDAEAYRGTVIDGLNGMLAVGSNQWVERLKMLVESADLRKEITDTAMNQFADSFYNSGDIGKLAEIILDSLSKSR